MSTDECDDYSVTSLRITLLKNAIENLAKISGCIVVSGTSGNGLKLLLSKKNNPENTRLIFCERVICDSLVHEYKM